MTKIENISEKFKGLNVAQQFKVLKALKSKNYEKILETESNSFLKRNNIEIIPTIGIKQQMLIDRAMGKIPPFKEGDKGFKDTVIWLSMLDDVEKNKDSSYIFCTNNTKDFIEEDCKDEFKKHSKKDFEIVKEMSDLKEYLDKKFVLKLALKALHEKIEDELRQKIGTITSKVISYISMNKPYSLRSFGAGYGFSVYGSSDYDILSPSSLRSDVSKFDFLEMEITNISKINNNVFNVNMQLILQEAKSSGVSRRTIDDFYSMSSPRNKKRLSVELEYQTDREKIEIISAQEVEL